ncbi:MAG: hypothetical protein HUU25_14825 [Candidatus Sumerlaeia bacterium]|nr:hypothetical protein [Candidatus Sumerlaeia bacterium]
MLVRLSPRCLLPLALVPAVAAEPQGQSAPEPALQFSYPVQPQTPSVQPGGSPYYVPPADYRDAEVPEPLDTTPSYAYPQPPQTHWQYSQPGYPQLSYPPPPQVPHMVPAPSTRVVDPGIGTGTYYDPNTGAYAPPQTWNEPGPSWQPPSDVQDIIPGQNFFQAPYEPPSTPANFLPEPPSAPQGEFETDSGRDNRRGNRRGRD